MPSQDLSAWVKGKSQDRNSLSEPLPVVKEISPLSLGEVVKNPLDADTGQGV
jgi:phosphatidylinositol-bisphosphatase